MAKPKSDENTPIQKLRSLALGYPEAEEGIACKGTAAECATVRVRKKAFLFLAANHLRLKLKESVAEAAKLAKKEPERYEVGIGGWIKIIDRYAAPLDVLERWIGESYRLMAPKTLAAMLAAGGAAKVQENKTAARKSRTKGKA